MGKYSRKSTPSQHFLPPQPQASQHLFRGHLLATLVTAQDRDKPALSVALFGAKGTGRMAVTVPITHAGRGSHQTQQTDRPDICFPGSRDTVGRSLQLKSLPLSSH